MGKAAFLPLPTRGKTNREVNGSFFLASRLPVDVAKQQLKKFAEIRGSKNEERDDERERDESGETPLPP